MKNYIAWVILECTSLMWNWRITTKIKIVMTKKSQGKDNSEKVIIIIIIIIIKRVNIHIFEDHQIHIFRQKIV